VLGNPAQGGPFALGGTLALGQGDGQINQGKRHRGPSAEIQQLQAPKGHHQGLTGLPQVKPLEQPAAGLGEGIGPRTLQQGVGPLGIDDRHPPASISQGKGSQGTGGAGTHHLGLEWLGHGQTLGTQKNRSKSAAAEE
jgi:hypothetical protein